MSSNYQFDRSAYDPYDQDYESGYSGESREYRDLYNPYKSIWNQALKSKKQKQDSRGGYSNYRQQEASRFAPQSEAVNKQGYRSSGTGNAQVSRQPINRGVYHSLPQREEEIFDSGYDVTRRNTYGYRTTGYGPRD